MYSYFKIYFIDIFNIIIKYFLVFFMNKIYYIQIIKFFAHKISKFKYL